MNAISDGFGSAAGACAGAVCDGGAREDEDESKPSIKVADLVCIAACNNIHAKNKISNAHVT